ncbi:MAG TPA: metallophosphoesterase family protein [Acidobacteriota bacterium]|nr:metallophosphoesterase family protein [Acidobacteriota bacterium]
MIDRRLKRLSIERGHLDFWHRRGRGSFHLENIHHVQGIIDWILRLTGLSRRGARNVLDLELRWIDFSFPDLPPSFDGYSILHLSDLHIDCLPGLSERLAAIVSRQEVDLCVLTGDYRFDVKGSCEPAFELMRKVLPCVRSRDGLVGILGNHDFLESVSILEQMGVRMLLNDSLEIRRGSESIWLVGLDDPHYYGCDDLPAALRNVPHGAFKILLVHSPEMFREAAEAGFALYLCGHTHAGQICLPWIGPVVRNAACPRDLIAGRWRYGRVQGYTSAGIGASLFPVRFRCRPEVTIIRLQRIVN